MMGIFSRMFGKPYDTIDAQTARDLVANGAVLVDVRTDNEWKGGHPPIAKHLPLETLGRRATELPSGAHIVTICHSGARSAVAARTLGKKGFAVSSVRGGIGAWKNAGGPITGKKAR